MSSVKVKICGVRDEETAVAAARARADFVGVVFVPSSPRYVEPAVARRLAVAIADAGAIPVAVVRLPLEPEARQALEAFSIVQFHGNESPADLHAYKSLECWKGLGFSPDSVGDWLAGGTAARLVVEHPIRHEPLTMTCPLPSSWNSLSISKGKTVQDLLARD